MRSLQAGADVAVVGAGIAGLAAARALRAAGHSVIVFDKGRGPGGRASSRRAEPFAFDHGAQYFTVRDPRFQTVVDALRDRGVVAPWTGRIVALSPQGPRPLAQANVTGHHRTLQVIDMQNAAAMGDGGKAAQRADWFIRHIHPGFLEKLHGHFFFHRFMFAQEDILCVFVCRNVCMKLAHIFQSSGSKRNFKTPNRNRSIQTIRFPIVKNV